MSHVAAFGLNSRSDTTLGSKNGIAEVRLVGSPRDPSQSYLVDIYRDGKPGGLFVERPKVNVPREIAGIGSHPISAGGKLTVTTDARKRKIIGDWAPGKYKANVRIENLTVERNRCTLSVLSEPFEFEIR